MRTTFLSVALATAVVCIGPAVHAEQALAVMAFSGLFQDAYDKAVVQPFQKENPDIKINYFGLPTSGQMLGTIRAQKAAPQMDVAIMDVAASKAGSDEGIFTKSSEQMILNIADLRPETKLQDVAGVGINFDNFALLYHPFCVKTPPKA